MASASASADRLPMSNSRPPVAGCERRDCDGEPVPASSTPEAGSSLGTSSGSEEAQRPVHSLGPEGVQRLDAAADPIIRATLTVPGQPEHVATARRFVTAVFGEDHPQADTAILLTSELVTNSLRHSASGFDGARVLVAASRAPGRLRVEVMDDGATRLPALRPAASDAEQGRGLHLVDALATRWDTRHHGSATLTWFEIDS